MYDRLLQAVRRGQIGGILVWHVNRLARNMKEAGELSQLLIDGQITEIRTPQAVFRSGDNILPLLLEQGMSTQYSLDLSNAVKRGMQSAVAGGGWPHFAKLGYLNARDPLNPKRGVIVPDPERFDLTRRGFDLMLTGGYSVREAVDIMNSWGLQTKPTPRRPGQPLSYSMGYDLFTNRFYAGMTEVQGVLRRGKHVAMISLDEYNRLQAIVKHRGRYKTMRTGNPYTGLMKCGYCGLGITVARHTKKSGRSYVYYRCSNNKHTCTQRGMSEHPLEKRIIALLESVTIDPELCEIALACINRWHGPAGETGEQVLVNQQERLRAIESQRDTLLTMMLSGLLADQETYARKDADLLRERNELQIEIETSKSGLKRLREQARAGLTFTKLAKDSFLLADVQLKREIARALGTQYTLKQRELTVAVDPVLVEVVRFTDQIMVALEPGLAGSESRHRADFRQFCRVGRDARLTIEPPDSLIEALKSSHFPNLSLVQVEEPAWSVRQDSDLRSQTSQPCALERYATRLTRQLPGGTLCPHELTNKINGGL